VSREDRSDEDRRQQHGFLFEACKQFTTLNTATTLVVLALYRDAGLSLWPVPFLGCSLLVSVYGMYAIAIYGTEEMGPAHATNSLMIAAITFVGGIYLAFAGVFDFL
jgi:hypothetical protein